jgi:CheY-like chemotaxis protein
LAGTVLIVDDDRGVQATLEAVLTLEGYDVLLAANGEEALARLAQQTPAVIVLDWAMPRMDGPTFAAALAQRGLRPAIPLLVLTADGRGPHKAAQIGAEAFIAKPFEVDTLLDEVARLIAA